MKHSVFYMFFALLAFSFSLDAASYFTDKGSIQLGGNIAYLHRSGQIKTIVGWRDYSYTQLVVSPVINFFPVRHFLVGPALTFYSYDGSSEVSLGANLGLAYGKSPVIPYAYGSPQVVIMNSDNQSSSETGFLMNLCLGIMIPVQKRFTVNMGPLFSFFSSENEHYNDIYFQVGITGWIL